MRLIRSTTARVVVAAALTVGIAGTGTAAIALPAGGGAVNPVGPVGPSHPEIGDLDDFDVLDPCPDGCETPDPGDPGDPGADDTRPDGSDDVEVDASVEAHPTFTG